MLNALAPADWQPDLSQLDAVVGSLRIQGMPRSGLPDIVWQWTGSTDQGKRSPITDPTRYEVVYGANGALSVKADCNRTSGAYTYQGGMVGSVRAEMGPTTLAACGPASRSEELLNSLMAAQDYRVQPGGSELKLNMPAGGPVLSFRAGGAAQQSSLRMLTPHHGGAESTETELFARSPCALRLRVLGPRGCLAYTELRWPH